MWSCDRDDLLDGLADAVPRLEQGAAQRLEGGLAGGLRRTAARKRSATSVWSGEGDLLLAGEVAEEGALGDVDGLGDLVDGRPLVPLRR